MIILVDTLLVPRLPELPTPSPIDEVELAAQPFQGRTQWDY